MDKPEYTPEQLASLALKFSKTPYGQWLMDTLAQIDREYINDAKRFTDPAAKLTALDRAAGVSEVTDLINGQVRYAEHPDMYDTSQKTIDKTTTKIDS